MGKDMTWRDLVHVVPGVPARLGRTLGLSMALFLLCNVGAYVSGQTVHWGAYVFVGVVWVGFVIWYEFERWRLMNSFWNTLEALDWEQVAREHHWDPERMLQRQVQIFNEVWGREVVRVDAETNTSSLPKEES